MANDLVEVAGYVGLISDNRYDKAMDAAINAGTMATLLPTDFNISGFGAAGFGFLLTSLQGTFPVQEDITHIVFQPLQPRDNPSDPAFVAKVIKDNFATATDYKDTKIVLQRDIAQIPQSDITCKPDNGLAGYNPANLTHKCDVKDFDADIVARVAYTYNGSHFKEVMPNYVNKPVVAVMFRSVGITFSADKENVFAYKKNAMVNNIAIIPFIRPNDEGKKVIFINGKATLV